MTKKGFTRDCADDVTRQLQSVRMVDDLEFARAFVRDRLKRKPTGQALLRMQLIAKGIPSSMTDMVLAELISQQNQRASAFEAAKRKMRLMHYSKKDLGEEKRKKRLDDFFAADFHMR